jgi:hypothetical protein
MQEKNSLTTQFQPGQSGNPAGRPPGKTPGALLRKTISEHMPAIVQTLVDSAKTGDVQAAKVLLDRVCPPLKPQAMPIGLPVSHSLAEQGGEIITAILTGQIAPDVGSQLITALSAQCKLITFEQLMQRIEALEKKENVNDK